MNSRSLSDIQTRAEGESLFPSKRRGAPFLAQARCEGANSARLFTPGERNALAKSKVHQISRAHGVWVVISLISKYGCWPGVEEPKILKTCKKAWEIVSHNIVKLFFNF